MKHLEELEKELEALLSQQGKYTYMPLVGYLDDTLSEVGYEDPKSGKLISCNKFRLDKLLLERQILQAYDAIEERKRDLRYSIQLYKQNKSFKFESEFNDKLRKLIETIYHNTGEKISDYEWEWLSKHEGGDDNL